MQDKIEKLKILLNSFTEEERGKIYDILTIVLEMSLLLEVQ